FIQFGESLIFHAGYKSEGYKKQGKYRCLHGFIFWFSPRRNDLSFRCTGERIFHKKAMSFSQSTPRNSQSTQSWSTSLPGYTGSAASYAFPINIFLMILLFNPSKVAEKGGPC